ncbi:MAG: alpha/beta fold hydrolase [Burkholderiales bacterium]
MSTVVAPDGAELFYTIDDFTDPWSNAPALVLVHGNAESGEAWRAWIPHLARHYRVLRVDTRGFGRSTPMPADYPWTIDVMVDDLVRVTAAAGIAKFHLVGAKLGGTFALRFAADRADLVDSLCVIGVPASPGPEFNAALPGWVDEMKTRGVRSWAASTMCKRLGSKASEAHMRWWADMMGATALSTQMGFMKMVATLDVAPDLPRIRCPTLVIISTGSALWSVEGTRAWQRQIARSELVALQSDSYHVAAAEPDLVAPRVRAFVDMQVTVPPGS